MAGAKSHRDFRLNICRYFNESHNIARETIKISADILTKVTREAIFARGEASRIFPPPSPYTWLDSALFWLQSSLVTLYAYDAYVCTVKCSDLVCSIKL